MLYESKDAVEITEKIRNKSIQQWQDPEKIKKIMDEKRNRFSKPFNVYKDNILIDSFDYVPDCAFNLFGKKNDSNISAVLAGRKKLHKGYVFEYKFRYATILNCFHYTKSKTSIFYSTCFVISIICKVDI